MRSIILFLLLCYAAQAFCQNDSRVKNIPSYEVIAGHEDLQFLNEDLTNVRVVGMGESTHGTREFNLMYLKVFRYLVEEHGYNTLFLEDEFAAASRLNEYVNCVEACESITAEVLGKWPWVTQEMNDLVEWIRQFNQREDVTKISIVGIDVQDPKSICGELNLILDRSGSDTVMVMDKSKRISSDADFLAYHQFYASPTFVEAFSTKASQVDEKYASKYALLMDYLRGSENVFYNKSISHLRDLHMGKNLLSYLNKETDAKGMLIAHNGHAYKYEQGKKNEMKNYTTLGGYLAKMMGDQYYVIIQDFDSGCFNAYLQKKEGSTDDLANFELSDVCVEKSPGGKLKSVGHFLRRGEDIQFVKSDDLSDIVTVKYMGIHNIGAVFNPLPGNPGQTRDFVYLAKKHFDACIFHQRSTPTTFLQISDKKAADK